MNTMAEHKCEDNGRDIFKALPDVEVVPAFETVAEYQKWVDKFRASVARLRKCGESAPVDYDKIIHKGE